MVFKRNIRGGVPSPYPRFLFHGLRTIQLASSIIVSGIMAYFMYYMKLEHYAIPWTFIILMVVSLATMIALMITIIFYNFTYLSPRFNLILNGGCGLIWGLGLGLVSWSISTSHVLAKQCSGAVWGGEAEASVCRDYKALWAMTLCGTVSTIAALVLDISIQNKVTFRGKYARPKDDIDAAQRVDITKAPRIRGVECGSGPECTDEDDQDIGYHNHYSNDDAAVPLGRVDSAENLIDSRTGQLGFRD